MIALIEIPHQRKARLHWYAGESDVIEAAIEYAAESDREEPDDFQAALDCLADDLHRQIVVRSAADVHDLESYSGHQAHVVSAMLAELREQFTWHIEARDEHGQWDRAAVEETADGNEFGTEVEAEMAINELRALGDDWNAGEYRVKPTDD